ncbi:hypothetical protein [Novipirellula artificiosorum]|uniref:Uncharacterized protein n=1 Tax=Novipirellula artificiosorum TaxID=2528016 RepID=A0A5C6C9E2_9BACT|nr:hypothetical protein [Novipirellula artificiosorum]TWU21333.1 hypothetical protein Poly41_71570 [Novipirellula artificiosorum]
MSQYYVQSGNLRTVVQAQSSVKAAIWAVHQAMQQVLPVDEAPTASVANVEDPRPVTVIMLAKRIRISERGFDRRDATELSTLEVMSQWNEMVATLDRLERMMHAA